MNYGHWFERTNRSHSIRISNISFVLHTNVLFWPFIFTDVMFFYLKQRRTKYAYFDIQYIRYYAERIGICWNVKTSFCTIETWFLFEGSIILLWHSDEQSWSSAGVSSFTESFNLTKSNSNKKSLFINPVTVVMLMPGQLCW